MFNDVDILTDSTGIWVVYTNEESQGYIILVKLNPVTLSKEYSTRLNTKQETLMNCFMVGYREIGALLFPWFVFIFYLNFFPMWDGFGGWGFRVGTLYRIFLGYGF